jgi:hypothetical protein
MKHKLPARPARALVGGTSPLIGAPETFALLATSDMSGSGQKWPRYADIVEPSRHVRIVPSQETTARSLTASGMNMIHLKIDDAAKRLA